MTITKKKTSYKALIKFIKPYDHEEDSIETERDTLKEALSFVSWAGVYLDITYAIIRKDVKEVSEELNYEN